MAKATTTTEAPYDPEKSYKLVVRIPVQVKSAKYLPRHDLTALGSVLNDIVKDYGANAIRSADPVE